MLFNSFEFFVFYVAFFCAFFAIKEGRYQIGFLSASSLLFYGLWNPNHVPLILLVCCTAYFSQMRLKFVGPAVTIMLGILFFFKYYHFFHGQLGAAGLSLPSLAVVLPVGISFYTFRAISFALDKKRGATPMTRGSFMSVVAYVSFFPQLLAGPIARAEQHLPQLTIARKFNKSMLKTGLMLFAIGMFKKVVVADNLGTYVNQVYLHTGQATSGSHWLAFYLYAIQIYYDFSGYSDMAIGIARTLGYKVGMNFNRPYLSASVSEFWRRWHISLSGWLRDYLYIALGGNRKGKVRTYVNLAIVMVLAGLWHGSAWTFVTWGGLLAFYLIVERTLGYNPVGRLARVAGIFVTVNLIAISWVFFRSPTLTSAIAYFRGMLDFDTLTTFGTSFTVAKCLFLAGLFFVIECLSQSRMLLRLRHSRYLIAVSVVYVFLFLLLGSFSNHPFIYFQF